MIRYEEEDDNVFYLFNLISVQTYIHVLSSYRNEIRTSYNIQD